MQVHPDPDVEHADQSHKIFYLKRLVLSRNWMLIVQFSMQTAEWQIHLMHMFDDSGLRLARRAPYATGHAGTDRARVTVGTSQSSFDSKKNGDSKQKSQN